MRCRLVTLASLLSLVLCLAATLVWAIDIEAVGGAGRDPRVVIELLHGRITVALTSPRTPAADVHDLRTLAARGRTYRLAGFEYDGGEESGYVNLLEIGTSSFVHEYHAVHRVVVPYWAVIVVSAAAVLLRIRSWRGEARAAARSATGACVYCGYDLRATPDRCPECGNPFAAAEAHR